MKYLKFTFTILFISLLSSGLFSQGFYISANAGYAFSMDGQQGWFSDSHNEITQNYVTGDWSSTTTYKEVKFSLGKGMNFGGSVGYMFNDYIGIDLGLNYLYGSETAYKNTRFRKDIYSDHIEEYNYNTENLLYSRMFRVIPAVVISPNFEKFNPYLKIGVVLGFGSFYWESTTEGSSTGQVTPTSFISEDVDKFYGGLALGINGGIGADYKVSEKLFVFGEINLIGMSYNPQKMEVTKRTINGKDQLPNMTTREKETEFVKEYTETYNPVNEDEPRKETPLSFPFSSLGLNFGVKFNL